MDISEADRGVVIKSKRPSDSNFKQQRLPSWQPVLTAGTVLPTFFIIGIAFIPVGVILLHFSNNISEHIIDYTMCNQTLNNVDTGIPCSKVILQNPNSNEPCMCRIPLRLNKNFEGNVFMYYGLTNFYQNHRRYVKSRDDNQLLGEFGSVSSDCVPFDKNDREQRIVPCGAIANSLFNDTLILHSDSNGPVPTLNTGIAWLSDKEIKFRNPPNLKEALQGTSRPIAWRKELWELDLNDTNNNGLQNEDLIVWMRTAALPSFRKLYRRVDHSNNRFRNGLSSGNYHLEIVYNYPVTPFDGTKLFILSTTSILGGKNPFLGWSYIVVGSICIVLGVILLVVHLRFRSHAQSSANNTNPRTPYT